MPRAALLHIVLAACAALSSAACGEAATGSSAATAAAPAAAPSAAPPAGAAPAGAPPAAAPPAVTPPAAVAVAPPAAAAAEPQPIEERSGVTSNGTFVVTWVPLPDPIPFNEAFKLQVTVARAASPTEPERSARLEVDATMPAHGHGMNRSPRVLANGDGSFLVEGMLFHMSGEWSLIFHAYVGSEYGQTILRVELP